MLKKLGTAEKLLEAAEAELIASDGQMEMAAVARRAGVSVGLAYHHFGSKAGLVAAVVDAFYGPLREISLGTAIPPQLDWPARERARGDRAGKREGAPGGPGSLGSRAPASKSHFWW